MSLPAIQTPGPIGRAQPLRDKAIWSASAQAMVLPQGTLLEIGQDVLVLRSGLLLLSYRGRLPGNRPSNIPTFEPGVHNLPISLLQPGSAWAGSYSGLRLLTLAPSRAYRVPRAQLEMVPSLRLACWQAQLHALNALPAALSLYCYERLASRLSTLLLAMSRFYGPTVEAPHSFLAACLGVHREDASLVLRNLRAAGLVRTGYGWVELLDKPALEDLTEEVSWI